MEMAGTTRPFFLCRLPRSARIAAASVRKALRRILRKRNVLSRYQRPTEDTMSKGLDKKKEQKKKPAKSLKEKRAEKSEKKASKN
jgi:hypothetical protein